MLAPSLPSPSMHDRSRIYFANTTSLRGSVDELVSWTDAAAIGVCETTCDRGQQRPMSATLYSQGWDILWGPPMGRRTFARNGQTQSSTIPGGVAILTPAPIRARWRKPESDLEKLLYETKRFLIADLPIGDGTHSIRLCVFFGVPSQGSQRAESERLLKILFPALAAHSDVPLFLLTDANVSSDHRRLQEAFGLGWLDLGEHRAGTMGPQLTYSQTDRQSDAGTSRIDYSWANSVATSFVANFGVRSHTTICKHRSLSVDIMASQFDA